MERTLKQRGLCLWSRMTNCPTLPRMEGFLKCGTFSAKTRKFLENWDICPCGMKARWWERAWHVQGIERKKQGCHIWYNREKVLVDASEAGKGQVIRGLGHHGKNLHFLQRTIEKPLRNFKQWHNLIWRAFSKDVLCVGWSIGGPKWSQREQLGDYDSNSWRYNVSLGQDDGNGMLRSGGIQGID